MLQILLDHLFGHLSDDSAEVATGPKMPTPVGFLALVVLGPRCFDMIDQRLTTGPGAAFQVMVAERVIEQFGLIEPGGMDRREAHPPPGVVFEVGTGGGGGMTGIAILDQENAVRRWR